MNFQCFGRFRQLVGIFLCHRQRFGLGNVPRKTSSCKCITCRGSSGRKLRNSGTCSDLQFRPAADLVHRQRDHVLFERDIEVVLDHELLAPLINKRHFLAIGPWFLVPWNVHDPYMGFAIRSRLYHEFVTTIARKRKHIIPVLSRANIRNRFLREHIDHGDVRLAVIQVELRSECALQNSEVQRCLGCADPVHVQHALFAFPAARKARFLAFGIREVEHVIIGRVHREIHVHGCTEHVKAFVVTALEHVVATHAVVAFAAEVKALAIGCHEREVLVLSGIDVSCKLHWRGELPVRHQLRAINIPTCPVALAITGEVDRPSFVREIYECKVLALLVRRSPDLIRCHNNAATNTR